MLIKNAVVLTLDSDNTVIQGGCVAVEDDVITGVYTSEPENYEGEVIDAEGGVLMSGFSNAHAHIPMMLLRGLGDDLPLNKWLFERIFPLEDKLTEDAVYWASMKNIAEMAKTGTTSVSDMYFFSNSVARAMHDIGMPGMLCRCITGSTLIEAASRIDEAKALYDVWNSENITVGMSLHAEYTCGDPVIEQVSRMAFELGTRMHIHASETAKEHAECIARHGRTPIAHFAVLGAFDVPATAAHAVHVTDADMEIMAERGVTVAHCPKSNLKLASGMAPIAEMQKCGVNIAIGTDGSASNNCQDMREEARFAALTAKGRERDAALLPAKETLAIACAGGANAIGRNAGIIAKGKKADLVLYYPRLFAEEDPASWVLYASAADDVRMTVANGRIIYREGLYPTVDINEINARFDQARRNILR